MAKNIPNIYDYFKDRAVFQRHVVIDHTHVCQGAESPEGL